MNIPKDLLYTKTHEWIRFEDSEKRVITVGITEHAQAELTDIVYVELPEVGKDFSAASPIAVVESVKAASDIYAPTSGMVLKVNESLQHDPSLINSDPFGAGWLFRLRLSIPEELEKLLTPSLYLQQITS